MAQLDGLVPLGQGREAEVYLRPDGTVLKLMRDPGNGQRVRHEAAVLTAVRAHGPLAPAAVATVVVDGRPGLVMERVAGPSLLRTIAERPWLARRAVVAMAGLHLRIHAVPAPAALPDLRTELRTRIEVAPDLPARLAAFALAVLDDLPDGDRICHGDFHPDNVLGPTGSPMAIDWPDACRGDPDADVARTWLLLRHGSLPPGAPGVLRLAAPPLRAALAHRYLAAYRRGRPVHGDALRRWLAVRAAARFVERLTDERAWLLAYLTGAARRAGRGRGRAGYPDRRTSR